MRNSIKIIFIFLFVAFVTSCSKDDEPKPNSPTDSRSILVGNWVCQEVSNSSTSTFSVELYAHSTVATRIVVSNFNNLGFEQSNCQMEINGSSFTIFPQNLSGFDVVGSGTLENTNKIMLTYTVDDGSGILDSCSAAFTKTN